MIPGPVIANFLHIRHVRAKDPMATTFRLQWSFTKESSRGILTKFLCQYRVASSTSAVGEIGLRRAPDVPRLRINSSNDASVGVEGDEGEVEGGAWMEKWKICVEADEINYCRMNGGRGPHE